MHCHSVEIPLWIKVALNKYATGILHYWEYRRASNTNCYDDLIEDLENEFEPIDSGSGRIIIDITEYLDTNNRFVAKVVGGDVDRNEQMPVTEGFVQNWREILLSRYPPVNDIVMPVLESDPTGLWLVMPFAEQYEVDWDHDIIDTKVEQLEQIEKIEPVMRGGFSGSLDVYWTDNWGIYNDEYRLIDYGGIVLHKDPPLQQNEYRFIDPMRNDI